MKRFLLSPTNEYKVNLHCHTVISDGKMTAEQLKRDYMAEGYSAVAFTDHDILIPHNDLTDDRFVALNGLEYAIGSQSRIPGGKTCHFCAVALEPDNFVQPCWHREKYRGCGCSRFFRVRAQFDPNEPDYNRSYSRECISDMMQKVRAAGFFVTYNHPAWSRETALEYLGYDGMHAMEICNFSCRTTGAVEYVPAIYDEMLRAGKRIFCTATDDTHCAVTPETGSSPAVAPSYCPTSHILGGGAFGGFVMIRAEKLEYRALTRALVAGDFYASQGPRIEELTLEDGVLTAKTSPARRILFTFGNQRFAHGTFAGRGNVVTEAACKIPDNAVYVRLTVEDAEGYHANTRAFFLDELAALS